MKDFTGRPESFQRKLSVLKYDLQNQGLSRNGSQSSSTSATVYEHKGQISSNGSQSYLKSAAAVELNTQNVSTPDDQNNTGFCTSIEGTEEISNLQYEKQLADCAVSFDFFYQPLLLT